MSCSVAIGLPKYKVRGTSKVNLIRSLINNSKVFTQISVINNFHYTFVGLNFDDLFFFLHLSLFIFGTVFALHVLGNRYLKFSFPRLKVQLRQI